MTLNFSFFLFFFSASTSFIFLSSFFFFIVFSFFFFFQSDFLCYHLFPSNIIPSHYLPHSSLISILCFFLFSIFPVWLLFPFHLYMLYYDTSAFPISPSYVLKFLLSILLTCFIFRLLSSHPLWFFFAFFSSLQKHYWGCVRDELRELHPSAN